MRTIVPLVTKLSASKRTGKSETDLPAFFSLSAISASFADNCAAFTAVSSSHIAPFFCTVSVMPAVLTASDVEDKGKFNFIPGS